MDSDSDSDDELLRAGPTFANKREENRAARAQKKQTSLLDNALKDCARIMESSRRLSLAKQKSLSEKEEEEDDDDDDLDEDNNVSSALTPHQRRGSSCKKTPASQGGVVDLEGGDEQDGALDTKRRIKLAHAYATERSSCLGTREIISFDMEREECRGLDQKCASSEEAIQRLEDVLSNFEKENSVSADVDNVVKSLRLAMDLSVLPDFLLEKRLVHKVIKTDDEASITPLLSLLTSWLYCTATSAGLMKASKLYQGALATLLDLTKRGKLPPEMLQTPVSHLFSELLWWIDSKDVLPDKTVKKDDSKVSAGGNSKIGTEAETNTDSPTPMDIDNPLAKPNNDMGLLNLLLFWEQLLPDWTPPSPFDPAAATHIIVALCRFGLDPLSISIAHEMHFFPLLQRVVSVMLNIVASQFVKSANGNESQGDVAFQEWMEETADAVFNKGLNQVGKRLGGMEGENAMDEDDDFASLCYASTVRLISIHGQDGHAEETDKLSVQFKSRLAIRALDLLCGTKDKHSDEENKNVIATGFSSTEAAEQAEREMPPLAWAAYSSVLSALRHLYSLGDDLTNQGPRSLATFECISMCFETALILINGAAADWDKNEYTPAQASVVVEILQTIDQQAEKLARNINGAMSNSHARRMDHHLNSFRQYYRVMRTRAARLTGDVEKVERQLKITSFAANTPEKKG